MSVLQAVLDSRLPAQAPARPSKSRTSPRPSPPHNPSAQAPHKRWQVCIHAYIYILVYIYIYMYTYMYIDISTPGTAIKTNTVERYPAKRIRTYGSRHHRRRAKEHQLAQNDTNKSSKVARRGIKRSEEQALPVFAGKAHVHNKCRHDNKSLALLTFALPSFA
jgi:lipopolysaccharide/colanic/teichoic acid biosynthesis glycosyltransferase